MHKYLHRLLFVILSHHKLSVAEIATIFAITKQEVMHALSEYGSTLSCANHIVQIILCNYSCQYYINQEIDYINIATNFEEIEQLKQYYDNYKNYQLQIKNPNQFACITKNMHQEYVPSDYQFIVFPILNSTNTFALENSGSLKHKDVIIAEKQTAGRGRQDHKWFSRPFYDFTFSLIFEHDWPQNNSLISLVVSIAVQQIIANKYKIDTKIKWPNDIFIQDDYIKTSCYINQNEHNDFRNTQEYNNQVIIPRIRYHNSDMVKICGILIEKKANKAIIGIGMNNIFANLKIKRVEVIVDILLSIDEYLKHFINYGFDQYLLHLWNKNCIHINQSLSNKRVI